MRTIFGVVFLLTLALASSGFGQAIQAVHFSATVNSAPLFITPGEVQVSGLQSGTTYITVPDGAGSLLLTPNDGSASISMATESVIAGDINSTILVSFILPDRLLPTTAIGSGYVRMRFTENSAAWGASGAETNYFDPKLPVQMPLDGSGTVHISLGGIFDVPPNTAADTFMGEALLTAQYTGL